MVRFILFVLMVNIGAGAFISASVYGADPIVDHGRLAVELKDGTRHDFEVELAEDDESRSRGLMFRDYLAPDKGMLFLFERPRRASFWMRNVPIPLDIIFVRENGKIANIVASAEPMTDDQRLSKGRVRAVLEIAGGRAEELGIKPGDTVHHPLLEKFFRRK